MTSTPRQVQILMKYSKTHGQEFAAAKAGMSLRTARTYLKIGGKMTTEKSKNSEKRTDIFDGVWSEIEAMLSADPGLQAKTLMEWLIDRDEIFNYTHLRTLQRRVLEWRVVKGPGNDIMFRQLHEPGKQSQS